MTMRATFVIGLPRLWTFTRSIPERLVKTWWRFIVGKPPRMSKDKLYLHGWVWKRYYSCKLRRDVCHGQRPDKDMNNGIVKFNFKHILSQVVFKAKTQYDNMQVDIDVIKIHNFKFAGAFTLPAAADGTGSWSSSDLAFPHAFTVVKTQTSRSIAIPKLPILPQILLCWIYHRSWLLGKFPKQPPKASWRPIMRSNVIWRSPAKSGSPELICWVQQANTKQFMFRSEIHGNRASVISTRWFRWWLWWSGRGCVESDPVWCRDNRLGWCR